MSAKQYKRTEKATRLVLNPVGSGSSTKRELHRLSDLVLWVEEHAPHPGDLDSMLKLTIQVMSRMEEGLRPSWTTFND
jgi:hypothetical protein